LYNCHIASLSNLRTLTNSPISSLTVHTTSCDLKKEERDGEDTLLLMIEPLFFLPLFSAATSPAPFLSLFHFPSDQKVFIPAFDVQSLLPSDLGRYYRYNGSLTTPPCHQSVIWTLFHERVQISKAQVRLKSQTKKENQQTSTFVHQHSSRHI